MMLSFMMLPLEYEQCGQRSARVQRSTMWLRVATVILLLGGIAGYLLWPTRWSDSVPVWVERLASMNTVNQVDFWIDEFYKEYGYYPPSPNRATVAALKGEDATANPRRKFLFYIQETHRGGPVLSPAGQLVDGWRRPLIIRGGGTTRPTVYSVGPNGIDDQGQGDDIVPGDRSAPPRRVVPNLSTGEPETYPTAGARP
jgi:hypothetical protein